MTGEENQSGQLSTLWHPGDSENVLTVVHKLRSHKLHPCLPPGEAEALLNIAPLTVIYVSGCQAGTPEACLTHH